MKQLILSAFAFFFLLANLKSQENISASYPHVNAAAIIGLHSGDLFEGLEIYGKQKNGPSFSLALGYRPLRRIELGFMVGMHYKSKLHIDEAQRANTPAAFREVLEVDASMTSFSGRLLYHYSQRNDIELYSGARLGYAQTRRKTSSGHYDYHLDSDNGFPDHTTHIVRKENNFSAQLILLGCRYYFTDNLNVGVEFAIGKPYFAGLQIGSRLLIH